MSTASIPSLSADDLARMLGQPLPTSEQREVIEAPLEPTLVVAGAGSGKTETASARVVYLVANSMVRPEQILGLTFGRKATGELAGRIRARLAQLREHLRRNAPDDERAAQLLAGEPTIATYHSYAARLVDEHGLRLGIEPASRVLGQSVSWQYVDAAVRAYPGDLTALTRAASTVTGDVLALAGELSEHLVEPDALIRWSEAFDERIRAVPGGASRGKATGGMTAPVAKMRDVSTFRRQLLPLVAQYRQRKHEAREVDFGDLLAFAARLAVQYDAVGRAERARFAVVLLDEYQDTSHAQRVLLRALFARGHPVMAVGDPWQSIYGWRGASAGNLARFVTDFPRDARRPAARLALTVSWRNGERILDVANALAAPLRDTGVAVTQLRPAPHARDAGTVRCALWPTAADEAAWVADRIAACWFPDGAATESRERPSVAVLCRQRRQFPLLEQALLARGVPVEIVGLGGLLDEPEVVDVVSTLAVLADPGAGDRLARLLTGPRWRIGPRDLVALGSRARRLVDRAQWRAHDGDAPEPATTPLSMERDEQASLIDALDDLGPAERYSSQGYPRLRRLATELTELRRRADAPLPDLVAEIERVTLLDIEVVVHSPHAAAEARTRLDRFLDVAADFASDDERATVTSFLGYLAAAAEQERGLDSGTVDVATDRAQLLTVHAAKGLEWDVVAIPGLVPGAFPDTAASPEWTGSSRALPGALRGDAADLPMLDLSGVTDQKDLTEEHKRYLAAVKAHDQLEERRLAYVAVTRARDVVLCSGHWWGETTVKPRGASAFLTEIRQWCVSGQGEVDEWADPPTEDQTSNPLLADSPPVPWPTDPLGARRERIAVAAEAVEVARTRPPQLDLGEDPALTGWREEAELLLSERDTRRAVERGRGVPVVLPSSMSVSALVALRRDPNALARRLRRPVPMRPAPLARRGTAFHAWLEELFGTARLLDLDELPGSADDGAAPDGDLAELKDRFLSSAWAECRPDRIEEPFETHIAGLPVRGRIDAVFTTRDGDGGVTWDVVDWKTGDVPTGADAEAVAVQLAVYRVAWADLHADGDVDRVGAAFHYVRADHTLRPADLLDRAGLEALVAAVPTG